MQGALGASALEKKDKSPVTVADFGSQALVCRRLRSAFGKDAIIAEEGAEALRDPANAAVADRVVQAVASALAAEENGTGARLTLERACEWIDYGRARAYTDRFWTLDPIDGTKGFLRGEQYAISLALIVKGSLTVAGLACPSLQVSGSPERGVVFGAVRGEGAFAVPLDGGKPAPARVSTTGDPALARLCESVESGHTQHGESAEIAKRLGITRSVRLDSQAKYAVIGRGEADVYLRLPTSADYRENIWDHAAGVLVVVEAGGEVTDVHGRPLDFTRGRRLEGNQGVVVTNGRLHERVLAEVQAVLAAERA